ncbi:MAG: hypothetical protein GDA54_01890 [Alphaproteobacteria bacterium GM7ARS4]|nr:hypothetical protein [Alphaproteobacteria bacterium GM7ARS4]
MLLFLAGGLAFLVCVLACLRAYALYWGRASSKEDESSVGRQTTRAMATPMVKTLAIVAVVGVAVLFLWRGQLMAALSSLPALLPFFVNWMPMWRNVHRAWRFYGTSSGGAHGPHGHDRGQNRASSYGSGAMTRQEALEILGLQETHPLNEEVVNKAYKDLMRRVHPDQGGSKGLAVTLNQARDTLLGC